MPEHETQERLAKGAAVLARIHREEGTGPCGWTAECQCPTPGRWCAAKRRWLELATGIRDKVDGPFGLIDMMKISEVDAAGITVVIEMPEGRIEVGTHGQISWTHFLSLTANVEEARSLLRILNNFRGSVVNIGREEKGDGEKQERGVQDPVGCP